MEIILKQDVAKLGHKDDIVKVRNGYATNFLIPQGLAILATESAKKVHAENMRQRAHKEIKLRSDAEELASRISALAVKVAAKASTNGKIFGSVNNIQIAEALGAMGIEIDRRKITINGFDNIKETGFYDITVQCYKDIKAEVKIEVVAEGEETKE